VLSGTITDTAISDVKHYWSLDGQRLDCTDTNESTESNTQTVWCAVDLAPGTYSAALFAETPDAESGSAVTSFEVIPSDAPVVTFVTDQTIFYAGTSFELLATVSDDLDRPTDLEIAFVAPPELLPVPGTRVVTSAGDVSQQFNGPVGTYTVQLTAADSQGNVGADSLSLEIRPENERPTCEITEPRGPVPLNAPFTAQGLVSDANRAIATAAPAT
jgi:hypothetical protein